MNKQQQRQRDALLLHAKEICEMEVAPFWAESTEKDRKLLRQFWDFVKSSETFVALMERKKELEKEIRENPQGRGVYRQPDGARSIGAIAQEAIDKMIWSGFRTEKSFEHDLWAQLCLRLKTGDESHHVDCIKLKGHVVITTFWEKVEKWDSPWRGILEKEMKNSVARWYMEKNPYLARLRAEINLIGDDLERLEHDLWPEFRLRAAHERELRALKIGKEAV